MKLVSKTLMVGEATLRRPITFEISKYIAE